VRGEKEKRPCKGKSILVLELPKKVFGSGGKSTWHPEGRSARKKGGKTPLYLGRGVTILRGKLKPEERSHGVRKAVDGEQMTLLSIKVRVHGRKFGPFLREKKKKKRNLLNRGRRKNGLQLLPELVSGSGFDRFFEEKKRKKGCIRAFISEECSRKLKDGSKGEGT